MRAKVWIRIIFVVCGFLIVGNLLVKVLVYGPREATALDWFLFAFLLLVQGVVGWRQQGNGHDHSGSGAEGDKERRR